MLLDGLHIPLTTPFHPDGRLNALKLAANVVRYSRTPAAGLIVLGPSGEPTLLSDDETREALRIAAQAAAPEKVLLAGISCDSVHATLDLARHAASLHYDAVLVAAPTVHLTPRELLTYFQAVADRSPLPLILGDTALDLAPGLAAHPNVVGLLTSASAPAIADLLARTAAVQRQVTVTPVFAAVTTRMQLAAAARPATPLVSAASLTGTVVAEPPPIAPPLRTRSRTVGFQVLSANTVSMHDGLRAGAVGIAPALAAAAPQACFEVFAAWKDSDQPLAEEKQTRLREAAAFAEDGPGTLKFACDLNGYYGGPSRLPHLRPTGQQRSALEQRMKEVRS
jgi:dihydrodipicolinate synthase/N-acetylneuraminate lyase